VSKRSHDNLLEAMQPEDWRETMGKDASAHRINVRARFKKRSGARARIVAED